MHFRDDEEDITSIYLERRRPTIIKKVTSDTIIPTEQDIELDSINEKEKDNDNETLNRNEAIKMNFNNDTPSVAEFSSLPPVDGGLNAYLVLISGFLMEGLVWGFPFSYSVMQQYYQQLPEFKDASLTELALVGTLTTGMAYIGGAVVGVLGGRFNLKTIMYTGSLLMSISLVGASFATHVWHLILCQGFLLGLGGSFLYNSFISFVPMYWYKYRGLATGIIFSGAGLFGIIFPIIIEKALKAIGFRWTLRIVAILVLIICLGSSIIIRPRHVPDANNNNNNSNSNNNVGLSKGDFKFLSTKKFLILGLAVLFQGLGYFIPNLFIQPYALSIGVSEHNSVNLVSILNAMYIVSQLLIGHISDRFGYSTAITLSSTVAALTTFFLWGFAGNNYSLLLAYTILYPIFGSGFTSCLPSMIYDVAESDHRQFIMINGAFMVIRGAGNLVGNPLGSTLLSNASSVATGYHEMTYFVGSAMIASAIFSTLRGILIKTR
ncbi:unnamed protein product [Cunninghamella blakesleeana]